jgi:hypothetical protein
VRVDLPASPPVPDLEGTDEAHRGELVAGSASGGPVDLPASSPAPNLELDHGAAIEARLAGERAAGKLGEYGAA